jgi:hypothetical protein
MRPAATLAAFFVTATFGLAGCTFDEDADDREQLQLVVDDEPLVMAEQTSITVPLIVLGDDGDAIAFHADELPPFATLTGAHLVLAPGDADAGDYDIPVTAAAGDRSDTEILRVHVTP